jgi:hypothetical protein
VGLPSASVPSATAVAGLPRVSVSINPSATIAAPSHSVAASVGLPIPLITVPPGLPKDAISSLLSEFSEAVATHTGLPEGAVIPGLVTQLSSLLASLRTGGTPRPTAPCTSGVPSFLTSVIPAVVTASASPTNRQSSVNCPLPSVNPPAAVPSTVGTAAPVFNPLSSGNVAVYFGRPDVDVKVSLLETCADPNVDIVILGFLTDVTFGGSIYPRLQLVSLRPITSLCPGQHPNQPEQNLSLARTQTSLMCQRPPGLSFYSTLEAEIAQCQARYG